MGLLTRIVEVRIRPPAPGFVVVAAEWTAKAWLTGVWVSCSIHELRADDTTVAFSQQRISYSFPTLNAHGFGLYDAASEMAVRAVEARDYRFVLICRAPRDTGFDALIRVEGPSIIAFYLPLDYSFPP